MTASEREQWVEVAGGRLWTVASGAGTPLLMWNGGPGCDDYLGPVARLIEDRCRVIRFEPRGCGRSPWDGRYDVATSLADAQAIRAAYGIDRWIVAGHSAGPSMAVAYALAHRAHTLGVIGLAGGKFVDDRDWSETYRARLASVGEDSGGKQWHADPETNRVGNLAWRAYCRQPRLLRALADLDVPCVFINGSEDIRPSWPTEQLAALLPRGRYVEIAGAAHQIWLTHAAALRAELHHALDAIEASRR